MADEHVAREELEQRWCRIYSALRGGGEVPPTLRLRTEGMMEALVLLNLASEQELQQQMAECHRVERGESLEQAWGEHWQDLFPFPQIPGFGLRAPVYPSTREPE